MSESIPSLSPDIAAKLTRNSDGLVPAVVQDATSGRVLMMAWMNDDSLAMTLASRQATYWSRSRQELWRKGATSGHVQRVREVSIDCDGDTLLLIVDQTGGACHTGMESCFDTGGVLLADDRQPGRDTPGATAEDDAR
ncbi:phosphoribosyl-AMP cyclohydrolase [Brooklawnia sp.]|uniref:phosphoribosyl-AMP cyclohydrolase n=1 Tax=Brooklawnia sp. TaxID=2699740 RepID=UPI00311DEF64